MTYHLYVSCHQSCHTHRVSCLCICVSHVTHLGYPVYLYIFTFTCVQSIGHVTSHVKHINKQETLIINKQETFIINKQETLIYMCDTTCDMTYRLPDVFIRVTWLIPMRDTTHSYVWHDLCIQGALSTSNKNRWNPTVGRGITKSPNHRKPADPFQILQYGNSVFCINSWYNLSDLAAVWGRDDFWTLKLISFGEINMRIRKSSRPPHGHQICTTDYCSIAQCWISVLQDSERMC